MLRRRPREPLFETVLVEDGRIRLLDGHLLRLRRAGASGRQVSAVRALAETWRRTARTPTIVRFDVAAGARVTSRPRTPTAARPVRLATLAGYDPTDAAREQKRADRGWTVAAEAEARERGADEPLLVHAEDRDELLPTSRVGETTRANLFVVEAGGRIVTPPVTGLLPGVTRGWALEAASAHEAPIHLGDLVEARAAFLTTAGRGIVPVSAIDGRTLGDDPRIDELREAWIALR